MTPTHIGRLAALPLLACLAVALLTGCDDGGSTGATVASLSPSGSTSDSASDSTDDSGGGGSGGEEQTPLAYSQCMREHGLADFPDPNEDGGLMLDFEPGSDLDPNNPTYQAADAACKPLLPNAGKPPAGMKEAALKYSACMREHGIADFPDPAADGSLQLQSSPGSDLDPDNPTFQSANEACKHLLPGGGEGGSFHTEKK